MKYVALPLLLLLLAACSQDPEIPEVMEPDPEPDSLAVYSFSFEEKSYEVAMEAKSWEDAVAIAVDRGGYLAEINSEEEQLAIFDELIHHADITFDETNNKFGFAAVWLGGSDLETEGEWVWNGDNDETSVQFWRGEVDGSPVDGLYHYWGNEPDNNGDQDVLCMGLESTPINDAGRWTDLDGDLNTLFFVIEYD